MNMDTLDLLGVLGEKYLMQYHFTIELLLVLETIFWRMQLLGKLVIYVY